MVHCLMTCATSAVPQSSLVHQLKKKFLELTMCEAQLEVLKRKFVLSEHLSVRISNTPQIIFTCTPEKKFMVETEVSLSGPAWKALCTEVDEVNRWLNEVKDLEEKEMVWMFHPMTKFLRVTYSDYGSMVSLLTMNRRGQEMKQHCVYLKLEEWEALTKAMSDITDSLNTMHMVKNSNTVKEMKTFRWMFLPPVDLEEGEVAVTPPTCKTSYLAEQHAAEAGMQAEMDCKWPLGKMVVKTEMKPPLEPMNFYLMVYFTILYHCCAVVNSLNCPGCKYNHSMGSSTHRTFWGCKVFGRSLVGDNLQAAKLGMAKQLVNEVFLKCWKALKLSITDVDKLWDSVQVMIPKDDVNEYLLNRVNNIANNRLVIPEVLLINDHIIIQKIKTAMYPHRHVEEESDVDSDVESSPKKKKKLILSPDSDKDDDNMCLCTGDDD